MLNLFGANMRPIATLGFLGGLIILILAWGLGDRGSLVESAKWLGSPIAGLLLLTLRAAIGLSSSEEGTEEATNSSPGATKQPPSCVASAPAPAPSTSKPRGSYRSPLRFLPLDMHLRTIKIHGINPSDISPSDLSDMRRSLRRAAAALAAASPSLRGRPVAASLEVRPGCLLLSSTAHVVLRNDNDADGGGWRNDGGGGGAAAAGVRWDADLLALLPESLRGRVTAVIEAQEDGSGDTEDCCIVADPPCAPAGSPGNPAALTVRVSASQCGHMDHRRMRASVWCESTCSTIRPLRETWRRAAASSLECDLELPPLPAPSSLVIRVGEQGRDGHVAKLLPYSCLVPVVGSGAAAAEASLHPELCQDLAHLMGLLCNPAGVDYGEFARGGANNDWLELAFHLRDFSCRNELEALAEFLEQAVLPRMLAPPRRSSGRGPGSSSLLGRSQSQQPKAGGRSFLGGLAPSEGTRATGRIPPKIVLPPPAPQPHTNGNGHAASSARPRPYGPRGLTPWLTFRDPGLETAFLARFAPAAARIHFANCVSTVPLMYALYQVTHVEVTTRTLASWALTMTHLALIVAGLPARRPRMYLGFAAVIALEGLLSQAYPVIRAMSPQPSKGWWRDAGATTIGALVFLVSNVTSFPLSAVLSLCLTVVHVALFSMYGRVAKAAGEVFANVFFLCVLYRRERVMRREFAERVAGAAGKGGDALPDRDAGHVHAKKHA